jgi:hypothetical protein
MAADAADAVALELEVARLTQRAVELRHQSHHERATEKWRSALAAALRLDAPDCLVVASLRVEIASQLVDIVEGLPTAQAKRALGQDALSQLALALATLRRRRDAGTLLHGTCRPAEEAWYAGQIAADPHKKCGVTPETAARVAAKCSPLVGYSAFINAAGLSLIFTALSLQYSPFETVEEGDKQFSQAVALAEEAVALMLIPQPEVNPGGYSGVELILCQELARFGNLLHQFASSGADLRFAAPLAARVAAAQLRLQRSGVLEARNVSSRVAQQVDAAFASGGAHKREAACAPERLRCCALASCGAKEAHVKHFSHCAACKTVVYCAKEHQVADWPRHKAPCKAARKAAAEAATGGNA